MICKAKQTKFKAKHKSNKKIINRHNQFKKNEFSQTFQLFVWVQGI